jgi:hypothetical protein
MFLPLEVLPVPLGCAFCAFVPCFCFFTGQAFGFFFAFGFLGLVFPVVPFLDLGLGSTVVPFLGVVFGRLFPFLVRVLVFGTGAGLFWVLDLPPRRASRV